MLMMLKYYVHNRHDKINDVDDAEKALASSIIIIIVIMLMMMMPKHYRHDDAHVADTLAPSF